MIMNVVGGRKLARRVSNEVRGVFGVSLRVRAHVGGHSFAGLRGADGRVF